MRNFNLIGAAYIQGLLLVGGGAALNYAFLLGRPALALAAGVALAAGIAVKVPA